MLPKRAMSSKAPIFPASTGAIAPRPTSGSSAAGSRTSASRSPVLKASNSRTAFSSAARSCARNSRPRGFSLHLLRSCKFQRLRFRACRPARRRFRALQSFRLHIFGRQPSWRHDQGIEGIGRRFEKATFSRAIGGRQTSNRAFLQWSIFDSANFYGVSFESCSLMGSSLRLADLRRCDFTDADLSDGDLSGADIAEARFDGADLRRTELQDFDVTRLSSFQGLKVGQAQQSTLLKGLGVRVFPD